MHDGSWREWRRNHSRSLVVNIRKEMVGNVRGWFCPRILKEDEDSQGKGDGKRQLSQLQRNMEDGKWMASSGKSWQGPPWHWEVGRHLAEFTQPSCYGTYSQKASLQTVRMSKLSHVCFKIVLLLQSTPCEHSPRAPPPPCTARWSTWPRRRARES